MKQISAGENESCAEYTKSLIKYTNNIYWTGGLADDHDVLRFVTHSLRSPEMAQLPDNTVDAAVSVFYLAKLNTYFFT